MSLTTTDEEIKDFTQFNWDKSKDYYAGRLKKTTLPKFKSQEEVEMFMGSLFSQFSDKDMDVQRFPMPTFGNTVKEDLDRKYRYDIIEKAKEIDRLFMERKQRKKRGRKGKAVVKPATDDDIVKFD